MIVPSRSDSIVLDLDRAADWCGLPPQVLYAAAVSGGLESYLAEELRRCERPTGSRDGVSGEALRVDSEALEHWLLTPEGVAALEGIALTAG